jgi:hypothetical protein
VEKLNGHEWWEIEDRISEIILANMWGYWDDRDCESKINGEDKAAGYIVDYIKDLLNSDKQN